jgi:ABC-type transport system involved in multi-copper enzyme maturation permease subunit
MLLPFGPIFRWEMAAIARRERNYVIRFIYGLVILTCFSFPLLVETGLSSAQELERRELVAASTASFGAILWGQAVALLLVTPAFFAGAIAQEVERGNLVLLLASPLRSVEIVLGKLGPRMAQVVLIVAVAVPVLALLSLSGGIDQQLVILSSAVLLTSALLIASTAMVISALSADVRQAVIWTYAAEILWLAAPPLIDGIAAIVHSSVREWASWAGNLWAITSPIPALWEVTTLPPTIVRDLGTTMLVQLGLAMSFIVLAAAVLRPLAKGAGPFGWRLGPVSFLLSRRRLLPRPNCGPRPVLWKEMHVARSRVLTRLCLALATLAILVALGWNTYNQAAPAFHELAAAGYGSGNPASARQEFNLFLRFTLVMIYVLSAIGLTVFCGAGMTYEKEKDTWTSLLATPLDGREIVSQKMFGAVWRLRWLGLCYFLLLALGVAADAIHPLGAILNLVQLLAFLGFIAGWGTYLSLRCRSSVRALGWAFASLFLLNGGYLLGCVVFRAPPLAVAFLVTPALFTVSLATYSEVDWFFRSGGGVGSPGELAGLILLNFVFYGAAAIVCYFSAVREFDKAAGRPTRDGLPTSRMRPTIPGRPDEPEEVPSGAIS